MRRTLYSFSIVAILVGLFIFVTPVKAQLLTDVANGLITGISKVLIQLAGLAMQLTIFALKFFILIAGYNNYIDADVVQLGWNMVRDVANMFFVVVLLVIAFGTILGLEQYEWKKTLVKLVMAAFFVNFSNLICQLIIDVAQVFTITFLNAVAGAAGGNLIKMFNFDEILNIATRDTDSTGLELQLFGGAVMTITFAAIAMFTMGAYLFVMIGRMVVLWTLMILSPLAFLFSALPNTQSYAQEFWNEFIHHVIVAPVMVFFLWLAFATFGGGSVVQTNIEEGHPLIVDGGIQKITESSDANGNPLGASFSAAASWENMANFAVAIAFLWIGIERVQKLGVVGGGIVSGALSFGKNVATIASGLAAARWLGGGAKNLASKGLKGAMWHAPLIGGEKWARRAKNEWEGVKSWYYDTGERAKVKRDEKGNVIMKNGKAEYELDDEGQVIMEDDPDRSVGQRMLHYFARKDIESAKKLEKTTKYAAMQKEYLDKTTTGVPRFLLMKDSEKVDAIDRVLMGRIDASKERSAAKTRNWSAKGKLATLRNPRFKDGDRDSSRGTVIEETVKHNVEADVATNIAHTFEEEEKDRVLHGGKHTAEHAAEQLDNANRKLLTQEEIDATDAVANAKAKREDFDAKAKAEVEVTINQLDNDFSPERQSLYSEQLAAENKYDEMVNSPEYQAFKAQNNTDLKRLKADKEKAKKAKKPTADIDKQMAEVMERSFPGEQALDADKKAAQTAFEVALKDAEEKKKTAISDIRKRFDLQMGGLGINVQQSEDALLVAQQAAVASRTVDPAVASLAATVPDPADPAAVAAVENAKVQVAQAQAAAAKYAKLEHEVDEEKFAIQSDAARKSLGLRYAASKQRASTAKASTEAAEEELREAALSVENIRALFNEEQNFKIGAQAAKGFIDSIQEDEVGKIFQKGSQDFKKALKEALDKGITGLKNIKIDTQNVGARLTQAETLAGYNKDIAGVNKKAAMDEADSAFTLERYGFDTPASAFNEWVKKRMESFQGVEREQAVKIAIGSLSKLQTLQQNLKKQGKDLDKDQQAQMMANVKYLTTQAWSDDLLARIVSMIDQKNSGQLYGSDKDEAQKLEDVFVKALKWGEHDKDGKLVKLDNRSGNDRTNDLHRLMAFGGDVELLQSESAVLRHSKQSGLGYSQAANSLARKVGGSTTESGVSVIQAVKNLQAAKASGADGAVIKGIEDEIKKVAEGFGIVGKTAVEEISSFADRFLTEGMTDFSGAVKKFETQIKSFSEATEMMADFKNLALAVGHIDDGGHTRYDMDTGFAHGQLADDALNFVISDWRKKGLDQRLSTLKSHSVMYMDENTGTARTKPEHLKAFRETFQGLERKLSFDRLDGRVVDHLATLAAGEAAILNAKGSMVIGDKRSVVVKEDHKGSQEEALKRIASDLAVRLAGNALATVGSLGERSGVGFDDSKEGKMNVTIAGSGLSGGKDVEIKNVEALLKWVRAHADKDTISKVGLSDEAVLQAFNRGLHQEDDDNTP